MAAISSLSSLINLATGGSAGAPEADFWFKNGRVSGTNVSPVAGRWFTLWNCDGYPSGGATPGAAAVPTVATLGALQFTNPAAGKEKWLIHSGAASNAVGTVILYDRLLHNGGLSGTVTTAQTVQGTTPSPAITRYTSGTGNVLLIEIYTLIGATATTLTVYYTDDTNTARTSTITFGGTSNREANRAQIVPLAAGANGVKACEKVQLTATTGTVGNFGVTIARPICYMPIGVAGAMGWRDFTTGLPTIPKIETDACLSFYFFSNGTTSPELFGMLGMVEA